MPTIINDHSNIFGLPEHIEVPEGAIRAMHTRRLNDEAKKTIYTKFSAEKQNNAQSRFLELTRKEAKSTLTKDETVEIDKIQQAWDWIKSIRVACEAAQAKVQIEELDQLPDIHVG